MLYVWDAFCRDAGAELCLVPSDDGIDIPTERILDAIDDRTAMVTLSHAIYVSGALLDIEAIVRRAHEVDAMVMVDVYQTLGTVPFDVQAWDADLVVGGSHKWLCGGPGTCFLYAKPEAAAKLRPSVTGWMGHAAPFAFEAPPMRYDAGSRHFLGGTPPMPGFFVARHAYRPFEALGMDRIRAHNLALSRRIIDRAQAAGLTVHSPLEDERRTGFVAVEFEGSQAASETLIAERFKHDWRPGCGLRIGPHARGRRALHGPRGRARRAVSGGRADSPGPRRGRVTRASRRRSPPCSRSRRGRRGRSESFRGPGCCWRRCTACASTRTRPRR